MRILITGARGRLGSTVEGLLTAQDVHSVSGVDSAALDITDFGAVKRVLKQAEPDVVIHCAAWTDVDGCAHEPERAIRVNGFGAQNVAVVAHEMGAAVVYVSSNEVFDGQINRPYREYDMPNPINPYGYSKWVGERAVMTLNPRHYIVRSSWFFASGGKNFIHTILNAARAGKTLRVVTDEIANPTFNDDLAEAIVRLIDTGRYGIYHFANEGSCSRFDFARYALDCAGLTDVPLTPITQAQWPRPSAPPVFSGLVNLAGLEVGITLRPWQAAVDAFLAD